MKSQRTIAIFAIASFLAALFFAVAFLFGYSTGFWALTALALCIILLLVTVMRNKPASTSSSSEVHVQSAPTPPPQ